MNFDKATQQFEIFFSNHQGIIDYEQLDQFNPELVDSLLDNPEDIINAAKKALDLLDQPITFQLKNVPESMTVPIRDLRSEHLTKLVAIRGTIKQASDVRPEITLTIYECNACATRVDIIQNQEQLIKPNRCGCGCKEFTIIARTLSDIQMLVIEEDLNSVGNHQAQRLNVKLTGDLVDKTFQKHIIPGNSVLITGILKDIPLKNAKKRAIYLDCINVETAVSLEDIELTESDIEELKDIADKDIYTKLTDSIASSIYGYAEIKEALMLQLFSGVRKVKPDVTTRGDIHILLVGDPGAGKSQILKYMSKLAPKGRYVVGKSASAAGLTASVSRDEFSGGWTLEAGALVLANNGFLAIDELEKMSETDRSAIHEAAEQQQVTISKATIQATLNCKTIILAAANPKLGRFDDMLTVYEQINLPDTLLSRFDLIFPIKDLPNKDKDLAISNHILKSIQTTTLSTNLIRKYIAYAKTINPELTESAIKKIQSFYISIRNSVQGSIPLTARQLEALVRLAEASARVRLSDKVLESDADRAIKLLKYCLKEVATDQETGLFDIDRFSTTGTSKRNKIMEVLKVIDDCAVNHIANLDEVIEKSYDTGRFSDIKQIEAIIDKLQFDGELFVPVMGKLRKVTL